MSLIAVIKDKQMGQTTLIKSVCVGAIVLLMGTELGAESYQQWLTHQHSTEISIEFNPFGNFVDKEKMAQNLDPSSSRQIGGRGTAIKLTRPSGGYIGNFHLRPQPSAQLQYPLSVALILYGSIKRRSGQRWEPLSRCQDPQ